MRAEYTSRSRYKTNAFIAILLLLRGHIIIIIIIITLLFAAAYFFHLVLSRSRFCLSLLLSLLLFLLFLFYSNGLISASWSCAEELFLFTTLPSRSTINFALKFHPTPPGNLSKQYDHIGVAFAPSTSPFAMTVPLNPFSLANFLMSALFANSCPPNCPLGNKRISRPSVLYFFSSATSPS